MSFNSDLAIRVSGVGKSYKLNREKYEKSTLADAVVRRIKRGIRREQRDTFWALHDVSFDVRRGDVLGVMGRNGAGKSTLLKILSRITEPTKGRIELRGRVGSLLEVGTGFHPELSGRENIFLNGAILGMSKAEIRRQFDAIVDFAGVERFLETPVKRYSSGMYVRLAFAVAAHLRGEILVVDEVLAVGDAEFQRKCLGKMKDVSTGGRTVLFVSHNMQAMRTLCTSGVFLEKGGVTMQGDIDACVERYLASGAAASLGSWKRADAVNPQVPVAFTSAQVNVHGEQPNLTLELTAEIVSNGQHKPAFMYVDVLDNTGTAICQAIPSYERFIGTRPGTQRITAEIALPPMIPGQYALTLWTGSHNTETLELVPRCIAFEIHDSPQPGRTFPHHADHGFIIAASKVVQDQLVA